MSKTVMIVDHSARADAVARAYLKEGHRVVMTAGNEFIAHLYKDQVTLEPEANHKKPETVLAAARKHKPDLVDVCQDDALALGVVNTLQENGFKAFGPSKLAAEIESSKIWARKFTDRHGIPHPKFYICNSAEEGFNAALALYNPSHPFFGRRWIKADGLCGGKGAVPADSLAEAEAAVRSMKSHGKAGERFLIEENIAGDDGQPGEEASFYTNTDGTTLYTLRAAQDHKRLLNFDEGPNTGGTGAVCPTSAIDDKIAMMVEEQIIRPTIYGMKAEKREYRGWLYTSVMIVNKNGQKAAYVVEFNSRLGAPEAETLVPRIKTPMSEIANACIEGRLNEIEIEEDDKVRVGIVGATRGYPTSAAEKNYGKRIYGLEDAMAMPGITINGAGIGVKDGKFVAKGGRLFTLVAEGNNILDARVKALSAMALISIEGNNLHYRTDIGWRDLERYYKNVAS